ncbi:hypothetical protein SAMD00023353_0600530 [Rosellinia necatrix]|uniref:Uncharacterized protein n=1 Tax=Rosellinia necatrix TaxID=77044 RepID=A0A1S8A5U6_ROSNE|nr:hypothetical protein SAMD00023353_0600530 [Rosellinia necatrix]
MSSQGAYTISIPVNMTPPFDLASYSRSMHSHTKRQMEAANMTSTRRSGPAHSPLVSTMPNGTSTGHSNLPRS